MSLNYELTKQSLMPSNYPPFEDHDSHYGDPDRYYYRDDRYRRAYADGGAGSERSPFRLIGLLLLMMALFFALIIGGLYLSSLPSVRAVTDSLTDTQEGLLIVVGITFVSVLFTLLVAVPLGLLIRHLRGHYGPPPRR